VQGGRCRPWGFPGTLELPLDEECLLTVPVSQSWDEGRLQHLVPRVRRWPGPVSKGAAATISLGPSSVGDVPWPENIALGSGVSSTAPLDTLPSPILVRRRRGSRLGQSCSILPLRLKINNF
jgi:hypothetical protein